MHCCRAAVKRHDRAPSGTGDGERRPTEAAPAVTCDRAGRAGEADWCRWYNVRHSTAALQVTVIGLLMSTGGCARRRQCHSSVSRHNTGTQCHGLVKNITATVTVIEPHAGGVTIAQSELIIVAVTWVFRCHCCWPSGKTFTEVIGQSETH